MQIKRKRILVTGGAGFIGSHIVESMVNRGAEVIVYDNFTSGRIKNIKKWIENEQCEVVNGDILDYGKLERVMEGIDLVSHQAAQLEIFRALDDPVLDLRINVEGTLNVLRAALRKGVEKVVYASSACVYGEALTTPQSENHPKNPQWPYGVSKLAGEKYCMMFNRLYGLNTVALRYGIVYGPREWFGRVLTIFIKRVLQGKPPVIFGNGEQRRDFIYVGDLTSFHEICLRSDKTNGQVYNVGSGVGTTLNKLAGVVMKCLDSDMSPVYEDVPEGNFSKYMPRRRIPGELKTMVLDISRARKLGWSPKITLNEGVLKEVEWLRKDPTAWNIRGEIEV